MRGVPRPINPIIPSKMKWKDSQCVGPLVADIELQAEDGQEGEASMVHPKTRRAPHEPTNEEIKEHALTHTPYRSWCPECVRARAKATPHHAAEPEEKAFAIIHLDYWFMRDRQGAELVPVANLKDDMTKTVKSHVLPGKGNVEGVADLFIKDIAKCGHTHTVIVKCDQEPALLDLRSSIQERRTPTTLVEEYKK